MFTHNEVRELNSTLLGYSAQDLIAWIIRKFGKKAALASSFGAEDVVLIDILSRLTSLPRVFLLDTGRLHQETYDLVDRVRAKYGINIEAYYPRTEAIQELVHEKGINSFYNSVADRKACCQVRKVEPLGRALQGADAWITGLRRLQAVTRDSLQVVELDENHGGILKFNPLLHWTEKHVWEYIHTHDVPYNRLHDLGFPSIGCAPCTRAVQPGEDIRAGRWWWETPEQKECGLHIRNGEVVRI